MPKEHINSMKYCIDAIDARNAKDPRIETVNGVDQPYELVYSQRMLETLNTFHDKPTDLQIIACAGHHLERWTIPRSDYSKDRPGYLKWRTILKLYHGTEVAKIMAENGYSKEDCEFVKQMIIKKNLKKEEPNVQLLEDVICLTFLKYYFLPFAAKHNDEKIVDILKKTWGKMSKEGQAFALKLDLPEETTRLVKKALTPT